MEIPGAVRNKASHLGAGAWLENLDDIVADLQQRWQITLGRTFPDGTEAVVLEATRADGEPAVLKLMLPRVDGTDHEVTVLRLANGDGCVRLLEADDEHGAVLLERLGPSLYELDVPHRERHDILCDTAAKVWRPAPDAGLPTGAEKGRWLIEHVRTLWDDLDRPCSERAVEHAIACAERRIVAHDDETARLVHGDVHQWNTLRDGDSWKLVDPDGLLADPEYDLGIILREDPLELLQDGPHEVAMRLAARTGRDPVKIWEWGAIERVSTGLLATAIGLQPIARQMLAAADVVATMPTPV